MIHPTTHDASRIQLVAEGLMRITNADVAADQLRRIYGERRTTDALLALTGVAPVAPMRTGATVPVVLGTRQHTIDRPRTGLDVCRRRGTRPIDWI